ncbi:MAG: hypothetical protein ABI480_12545 [Chitinophagaceae bacterium]
MNEDYGNGMETRLWDYIDGLSSNEEKTVIEQLLEDNREWKKKYHELLDVHQLMQSSELEHPSMRFSRNVMEEISRLHIAPATKTYINKNIIRGIVIFFVTTIISFLVYGFSQADWTSGSSNKWSVPVDVSKLDTSKFFNSTSMNVFMMINLILGLFLFDRYLSNKRKKHQESQ